MTEPTRHHIRQVLLALLLPSILLTACSERGGPDEATTPATAGAPAGERSIASLQDDPPADGSCLGWRRSLTRGSASYSYSVYDCLHRMAGEDWGRARAEAKQLADWGIRPTPGSGLLPLMSTLVRFDSPAAVRAELAAMDLVKAPDATDDEDHGWPAITAGDWLAQQGNTAWFDLETGTFPNEHDLLLRQLAGLAQSRLSQATFSEVPPSDYHADDEPYRLTGVLGGTEYRAEAQNYGDWYDLEAVLGLLNRIALQNALPERFVSLPTGDQTAIVWVVDSDRLATLSGTGLIETSKAEQAMIDGKAAEQEAIEDLKASGAKVILH